VRRALARRTAAVVLAVLCVHACSPQPSKEKPGSRPSAQRQGNSAYSLPDTPFTRKGTVVTADCLIGARYAAISVQAWNPETWTLLAERGFAVPTNAAFSNYSGVEAVNSPLVELCRQTTENPSPYRVDTLEHRAPRIRALFDLAFTRMAVVLRDPGTKATYAGFVESDGAQDDVVRLNDATSNDEQNAVMSPDGRSVWFTYTTPSGEQRIGSRDIEGDHRLSDEGPAAGHGLPLTVSGKPPRALQADMVRVSPNGRRLTANAPKVFGSIFDAPDSSVPLTGKSARNATLASDCVGIVGWIGDTRVLCRTSSGSFQVRDARSGRAVGAPVGVVGPYDGTIAEGTLVSADGTKFIAFVHFPNDPYREQLPDEYALPRQPDFRVVPTTTGREMIRISNDRLSVDTVFLEWW
jgi:hypothetical protein